MATEFFSSLTKGLNRNRDCEWRASRLRVGLNCCKKNIWMKSNLGHTDLRNALNTSSTAAKAGRKMCLSNASTWQRPKRRLIKIGAERRTLDSQIEWNLALNSLTNYAREFRLDTITSNVVQMTPTSN